MWLSVLCVLSILNVKNACMGCIFASDEQGLEEPQLMMSFVVGCFLGLFAWFGIVSLWHYVVLLHCINYFSF